MKSVSVSLTPAMRSGYISPSVVRYDIAVERGFAASSRKGSKADDVDEDDYGWY